jgi:hypothetical protein
VLFNIVVQIAKSRNLKSIHGDAVFSLSLPILNTSSQDDLMHLVLLVLSVFLVTVSVNGFRRKRNSRYFFLMLAFVFFWLDQSVTLYQEFYLNGLLISIPYLNLHLIHFLELLMSVSFLTAMLGPSSLGRRGIPESEF